MAKTITDLQKAIHDLDLSDVAFYQKLDAYRIEIQFLVIEQIVLMTKYRADNNYLMADSIRDELVGIGVQLSIEKCGVTYILPGDAYPYFIEISTWQKQ